MAMGLDPIWLGVMIALNLQTSFLTPPFGFSLFYLRGVSPDSVPTSAIYRGVIPFIAIQVLVLTLLALAPQLVTWLPNVVYPG
jgi:TRAP-type mannitol/chloroaromatic compound transport system permease large subunit